MGKEEKYKLINFHVCCGSDVMATATVTIKVGEKKIKFFKIGVGPIDAVFKAISELSEKTEFVSLSANFVGLRSDVLKSATVVLKQGNDSTVAGYATDLDIIKASVKAYLDALNQLEVLNKKSGD